MKPQLLESDSLNETKIRVLTTTTKRFSRIKKYAFFFLFFLLSLFIMFYLFFYSFLIGSPCKAIVRCISIEASEYEYKVKTLTGQQLNLLVDLMREARPTVFLAEHTGINNEPILINLFYEDGSSKKYSIWKDNTVLYAGDAEELTMSSMYGDLFHFGGKLNEKNVRLFFQSEP